MYLLPVVFIVQMIGLPISIPPIIWVIFDAPRKALSRWWALAIFLQFYFVFPLYLVKRFHFRKAPLFFLVIAILFFVLLIPVHQHLNSKYRYGSDRDTMQFSQNSLVRLSGTFKWRLTEWGIIEGDKDPLPSRVNLSDVFRIPFELAKYVDLSNPTPFMLIIWFLGLSVLSIAFSDKKE